MPASPSLPSPDLARLSARIALSYAGRQDRADISFADLCRTAYRSLFACAPEAVPTPAARLPSRRSGRRPGSAERSAKG